MDEIPEFRVVEVTHRGKTEIYWAINPWRESMAPGDAQGLDIFLKGRRRTVKHMEGLKRGQEINSDDYVGVSVYADGEGRSW